MNSTGDLTTSPSPIAESAEEAGSTGAKKRSGQWIKLAVLGCGVVIVVAGAMYGGYVLGVGQNKDVNRSNVVSTSSPSPTPSSIPTVSPSLSPTVTGVAGWLKVADLKGLGSIMAASYTFSYPPEWTFSKTGGGYMLANQSASQGVVFGMYYYNGQTMTQVIDQALGDKNAIVSKKTSTVSGHAVVDVTYKDSSSNVDQTSSLVRSVYIDGIAELQEGGAKQKGVGYLHFIPMDASATTTGSLMAQYDTLVTTLQVK